LRNKDLSLDLDIVDSAFSLGIGTPEPFGLHPFHIKEIINLLGSRKMGSDIVELDPLCDNGNIPIMVARFV
jgi:agmatinase